jgi:hypothetical protein
MKKLFLVLLIVSFIILSTTAFAAEKAPLGAGNLALKVDYINFTDSDMDHLDVDSGLYVGLEAYSHLADAAPNFYIGMEVGYASSDGDINVSGRNRDTEMTFVPIELNLKYAMNAAPNLAIDIGAGASMNYAQIEGSRASGTTGDIDDWLWGGQIFADLNYKFNQFFIGINAKYQITENFDISDTETDVSFRNWRFGGQIGIVF